MPVTVSLSFSQAESNLSLSRRRNFHILAKITHDCRSGRGDQSRVVSVNKINTPPPTTGTSIIRLFYPSDDVTSSTRTINHPCREQAAM
ncbi:hypothetical protein TNCV_4492971 [Trichonephila clavipes]|uniref:Uncharacterized protein n=1 Tax=Trichonephila clavipes TaxID=2585209 RepID=A0A8X6SJS6_TRICX|nr:hypothetical protein TNCV_4492971 [Trichonephila clavipes]